MTTTLTSLEKPPASRKSPRDDTAVGNYLVSNYPPYSRWNAGHISSFLQTLRRARAPGTLDLYVHVPFCRQHCQFCYFRVYARRRPEDVEIYLDSVLKELSLYLRFPAIQGRPIAAVYFGGGSPSYLEPDQIRRLLGGLQQQRSWEATQEVTFECEPRTITKEKLEILKELGVTRVSLGFYSLDPDVMLRSGRDVTAEDCLRAFHEARNAGFDEVNVDLLAGLPGETDLSWGRTIEQVVGLSPESLTVYQFELTYNSPLFGAMRSGGTVDFPDWPAKRRWVDTAFRVCEEAGYVISNGYTAVRYPEWWRSIYPAEHFWRGADLLALGESAFGHLQGIHYQNLSTFNDYLQSVLEKRLPLQRALRLRPEEKLRREVILQLKTGRLDAEYFRKKFGVDLFDRFRVELKRLVHEGLMEKDGQKVRLSRKGLVQVDALLPRFYLPEHVGIRYT